MPKIRVLVVDDSSFVRSALARKLGGDPEIEVAGFAANGEEALVQVKELRPDVVTLDVEMPVMDGLTALGRLMNEYPTPVVMLSSLTGAETAETLKALELGAVDFHCKASQAAPTGADYEAAELRAKVKQAARITRGRLVQMNARPAIRPVAPVQVPAAPVPSSLRRVVVIASSTGGPKSVVELFSRIPASTPAAFLLVQHMPAKFTTTLADRLNVTSSLTVREARDGDAIKPGHCLVAPGGFHMAVSGGAVKLTDEPTEHGVRPAADVTMRTAAAEFGNVVIGVVMTGMGRDGTLGAAAIKRGQGKVIVEHESTCVVYGMPRSVVEAGHADRIEPLDRMAEAIAETCQSRARAA